MAIETQGTILFWSTSTAASTSTAVTVGGIVDFSGPGGQANEIDITNINSSAKEYIIGLKDEGDFTMNLVVDTSNAGQTAIRADRDTRTKRKAVVQFNDSTVELNKTKAIFDAYVKGFSITGSVDDAVRATATLRIAGPVTYTTSSSI